MIEEFLHSQFSLMSFNNSYFALHYNRIYRSNGLHYKVVYFNSMNYHNPTIDICLNKMHVLFSITNIWVEVVMMEVVFLFIYKCDLSYKYVKSQSQDRYMFE